MEYKQLKYTIDVSVGSGSIEFILSQRSINFCSKKIKQFEDSKLALYTIYKNGLVSRTRIGELFKDLQSQINDHLIEQNK